MIKNLKAASPLEIDTRLAELHDEISTANAKINQLTNRVLDHAGLRVYVSATWETRKSSYRVNGTFEDGVVILDAYNDAMDAWRAAGYPQGQGPKSPSNYSGNLSNEEVAKITAQREEAMNARYVLWSEANDLEAQHTERRWPRYFLVVSSAGHIHSSTGCSTCRFTTQYGWMPQMSGMTEAEAMESLGTHAEALCTVCFPSAPVMGKAKVTKAVAAKMSSATYVSE